MASTTIIADLKTALGDTPTATTNTNANAAAGPIQDVTGNINLMLTKAQEMRNLTVALLAVVDAGDPINALILGVQQSLV